MTSLEYTITDPIKLNLLACVFYGDPFHKAKEWSYSNEIGLLWSRFMQIFPKFFPIIQKSCINPNYSYEVHYEPQDYEKTKKYYVYVGIEIEPLDAIPLDFVVKPLPKTNYAIIHAKVTEHQKVEAFIHKFLTNSKEEFIQAYPYLMQRYNKETYKGLNDPNSEMEWLIPVKRQ